jgi:lipoprotein-anchoring transpeptidase ErfK/SrfK
VRANAPTAGCIALDVWAAEFLYNFAPIGTRVEVHW